MNLFAFDQGYDYYMYVSRYLPGPTCIKAKALKERGGN